jgi:hypothetical protein
MSTRSDVSSLAVALLLGVISGACSTGSAGAPVTGPQRLAADLPVALVARSIPLPGSGGKPIALDYLACDRSRIWSYAADSLGARILAFRRQP